MKAQDQYLKFIRWEETDRLYVGYCPDLFPWGGACHGPTEEEIKECCPQKLEIRGRVLTVSPL